MSRKKRKSNTVVSANKRLAGLESIDPLLDLGNGNTIAAYLVAIKGVADALDAYNQNLSDADALMNNVEAAEKTLSDFSEVMLEAVGTKYGHDSNEYEMAGGTRKSERKRPVRKPKPGA